MNKLQKFQEFLATQSMQIPVTTLIFNLILTAVLAVILSKIYTRFGTALSNRKMFASNFMLISMTTMLVIAIVKTSLALSLGLVGALSIVRFRAAIKEPEELGYLFLSIAIGLGLGANQRAITLSAFVIICGAIVLRRYYHKTDSGQNLYLTVTSPDPQEVTLEKITDTLKDACLKVDLKRFDQVRDLLEASFLVELESLQQLTNLKNNLTKLNKDIKITFLDSKIGE